MLCAPSHSISILLVWHHAVSRYWAFAQHLPPNAAASAIKCADVGSLLKPPVDKHISFRTSHSPQFYYSLSSSATKHRGGVAGVVLPDSSTFVSGTGRVETKEWHETEIRYSPRGWSHAAVTSDMDVILRLSSVWSITSRHTDRSH